MKDETTVDLPPKPELLAVRWVCGLCLEVRHQPLSVHWKWSSIESRWDPKAVEGPRCHGVDMLVLGEPKVDKFALRGLGMLIDPLDSMLCPSAKQEL